MSDKNIKEVIILYPYKGSRTGAQLHFINFLSEYSKSHKILLYTTKSFAALHKLDELGIEIKIIGERSLFIYRIYLILIKSIPPVISVNLGVRNSFNNIVLFSNALVLCRFRDIVKLYDFWTSTYYTCYKLIFVVT